MPNQSSGENHNYITIASAEENEKQGIEAIATIKKVVDNKGVDITEFNDISGVAILTIGKIKRIYVLDREKNCIEVFEGVFEGKNLNYSFFGTLKKEISNFKDPTGIAFSAFNNFIYVADKSHHQIKIFSAEHLNFIHSIGYKEGKLGSDNNSFNQPFAVAVSAAKDKRVYVADSGNHRVQVFDGATHTYIKTLGVTGVAGVSETEFNTPMGVAVSASGKRIYVADTYNCRIQVFNFENNDYTYFATLGTASTNTNDPSETSNTDFKKTFGVAVSPVDNRIYVTDSYNHRIQVFDGITLKYIFTLGTGSKGDSNMQLNCPRSVGVSAKDNLIYVADRLNKRVQVFDVNKFKVDLTELGESTTVGGSKKRNTKKRNMKKRNMKKRNTKKQKY